MLLTGCGLACNNLTPAKSPQNASGIYTMRMSTNLSDGSIIATSVEPMIVVDGQTHPMQSDPLNRDTYFYDYKMPANQNQAAYYYVVNYKADFHGTIRTRQIVSDLHTLKIVNRYVHTLECDRGLVGSKIMIIGRGFNPNDQVKVGEVDAPTHFVSSTALRFTVPHVVPNQVYPVSIHTDGEALHVGLFRVDPSMFHTNLGHIQLVKGEEVMLTIRIDFDAPAEGLPLHITTDIPDSIVMEEVTIPAGERSVSVVIEAAQEGQGTLYIEGLGFAEKALPVLIIQKSEELGFEE